jgi:hypothetical protein
MYSLFIHFSSFIYRCHNKRYNLVYIHYRSFVWVFDIRSFYPAVCHYNKWLSYCIQIQRYVCTCLESCGKKAIIHVSPSGRSVCSEDSYTYQDSCESGLYNDTSFQCIRFQPFQETSWNTLCDHSLKELYVSTYHQ